MVTTTDVGEERSRLVAASIIILAAVASAAALYFTRPVMVPFVLSIFVYYLVLPLVDLLDFKLKMPRWLSVIITLLVVAGLLALLGLLITTSARGLLESQDIYRQKLADWAQRILAILDRWGLDIGQQRLIDTLREMPFMQVIQKTAGTMLGLVTNGFLVLIFVIFLLLGRDPGRRRSGMFVAIDFKVRQFIVMKFLISATTGTLVGIILALFGLDLALVFGVLAFLLNFIPSIGSVIATFLPLPVALVQFDGLWPVIGVILLPGAVQMTIGNVIEPKVMGEGLDLSPVTILLALVFWGLLWGVVGMLMAAPITAVLRIVLARFQTTRAVAELMAGRLPGEEAAAAPAT
jgi:AI-2 transport protein TqsA